MGSERAERFLLDLVSVINEKAAEPEVTARVSRLQPRQIVIAVYAVDAHLTRQEVAGSWAVRPDPVLTKGQAVYSLLASFGGGSPLRITPVHPSKIPEDTDGALFASVPVIAAIVVGSVQGPFGQPVPFDVTTAQRDGWVSYVGSSPADALAVYESFRGLIDQARSQIGGEIPTFGGGVAPELLAEQAAGSRSKAPSTEELIACMRELGAGEDEIRRALAAEAPAPSTQPNERPRVTMLGDGERSGTETR
jgi:hypothetical protein